MDKNKFKYEGVYDYQAFWYEKPQVLFQDLINKISKLCTILTHFHSF